MENEVKLIDANALARKIREYMEDFPNAKTRLAACRAVLSMLGDEGQTPTLQPNCNQIATGEPLTFLQLREMDGQPVWVERNEEPYDGKWFIVDHADVENPDKTLYTKEGVTYSDYGKYFTAYAYPPAHIDREAWTAEWIERKTERGTTQYICSNCNDYYEFNSDSVNSYSVNGNFWFCRRCGRAMTPEAWAYLEKRLRK